jgi:hypothetical protein
MRLRSGPAGERHGFRGHLGDAVFDGVAVFGFEE